MECFLVNHKNKTIFSLEYSPFTLWAKVFNIEGNFKSATALRSRIKEIFSDAGSSFYVNLNTPKAKQFRHRLGRDLFQFIDGEDLHKDIMLCSEYTITPEIQNKYIVIGSWSSSRDKSDAYIKFLNRSKNVNNVDFTIPVKRLKKLLVFL